MANQEHIRALLDDACREFVFSGYQLFCKQGSDVINLAGGKSSYWPGGGAVDANSLFDIGSVTKVVVGLTGVIEWLKRSHATLGTTVGELLPAFASTAYTSITVEQLLFHSSGLIDWLPFFKEHKGESVSQWLLSQEKRIIVGAPGKSFRYSDINFWLLREALDFGPLQNAFSLWGAQFGGGLQSTLFGPVPPSRSVATEYCLWRERVCWGEVFDENAAAMEGVACHAGLFSTASDLSLFCEEWLSALRGESRWLSAEWAQKFITPLNGVQGSTRALGWDTKSETDSSAGNLMSPGTFGHLGFTGTSLWIDPVRQGYIIFLTNRIHPSRHDTRIRVLRPKLHDLIVEGWGKG